MWTEHSSSTFLLVIAASIVAHVAALVVLPAGHPMPMPAPQKTFVSFETTPPPPPVEPTPIPVSPTELVTRATRPAPRRVAAPAPATALTPVSPVDAPVDFAGVTLSNEGAGWSSPVGNGEPITAPIAAVPVTRSAPVVRTSSGGGDRIVAVGDLSRAPKAPNLDTALAANYPAEARRSGTTGSAMVRARILADGSVGPIRVVSETAPGFGTACRRTLVGSRWQAPLDANHEPVITDINYTCTFAVAR